MKTDLIYTAAFRERGVTLIELIVTVVVIAITVTVAIPSYTDFIDRNRLTESLQTVKTDIQLARSEALKQSTSVVFSIASGADGTWCYGLKSDAASCDCNETDTGAATFCDLKRVLGSNFDQIDMTTADNIIFEARRATTTAASLAINSDLYSATIEINAVGRVRGCGGNIYDPC